MRIVVDTNVLLSSLFSATGIPQQVVNYCVRQRSGIRSVATTAELDEKLDAPKFRSRFSDDFLNDLRSLYLSKFTLVKVVSDIHDCRDPKDDKFLALALDGRAETIVTGADC